MTWSPSSVTYGIRHKRLFGFLDRAGDAIDAVVALQGTGAVPHKCFTRIGWPDQLTAKIGDDDNNYDVTLNVDGVVLTVNLEYIEFTHVNARDMFVDLVSAALPITNPGRGVDRLGIIENYTFRHAVPGQLATEALTRLGDVGSPSDFGLRIAFRKTPPDAPGDWLSTILQVVAAKEDESSEKLDLLRVSIDHQHYFVPERFFTPKLIREHYAAFMDEAESLQERQLHELVVASTEVHADLRDG